MPKDVLEKKVKLEEAENLIGNTGSDPVSVPVPGITKLINAKEPKIEQKKSGFNLEKTDDPKTNDSKTLASSKALYDGLKSKLNTDNIATSFEDLDKENDKEIISSLAFLEGLGQTLKLHYFTSINSSGTGEGTDFTYHTLPLVKDRTHLVVVDAGRVYDGHARGIYLIQHLGGTTKLSARVLHYSQYSQNKLKMQIWVPGVGEQGESISVNSGGSSNPRATFQIGNSQNENATGYIKSYLL